MIRLTFIMIMLFTSFAFANSGWMLAGEVNGVDRARLNHSFYLAFGKALLQGKKLTVSEDAIGLKLPNQPTNAFGSTTAAFPLRQILAMSVPLYSLPDDQSQGIGTLDAGTEVTIVDSKWINDRLFLFVVPAN